MGDQISLQLDGSAERRIDTRRVAFEPTDNVRSARIDARGWLLIERVDQARALRVAAPGLCPVTVAAGARTGALALRPVLELGGDRTGIGFATRFTVQARNNCPSQDKAVIAWRQLEGPALAELQVNEDGTRLRARTASFAEVHPEPAGEGIVAISPRTQGRVVLEASSRGPDGAAVSRTLTVTAAARATGLSSVAVSQPIVLAGTGWNVQKRPPGGHGSVQALDGLTFFTADAVGSWTLEQGTQRSLKLHALTHDATPYDCGRAECHGALSEHTAASPMSHALERPLSVQPDSAAVSCMLDCHVLGERGLSDGGFQAVAARLGFTWTEHTRWQDMPQALRRLGGVRCTACHGPGAIPPPEQRSAILQSDVCASCHDAPPRYVHVSQWRSGRMASSDRDLATRKAPCARCHTTAGFLAHEGVRKLSDDSLQQATGDAALQPSTGVAAGSLAHQGVRKLSDAALQRATGIACAACHAPHSAERGERLIRNVSVVAQSAGELFAEPSTELCRSCHAPLASSPDRQEAEKPGRVLGSSGDSSADSSLQQQAAASGGGDEARAAGSPQTFPASRLPVDLSSAAPSGTLWASQILVPAAQGPGWEYLRSPSVHQQVAKGCVGCHGGGALAQGAIEHSFRAEPKVCASCHRDDVLSTGRAAGESLRARALALSHALEPHCRSEAPEPSPHPQLDPVRCSNRSMARARYEIDLVLDDGAAVFHNPDLSRALLLDAERQLTEHESL